ncbi:hypothetical protein DRQ09_05725 [candidate division KSB1 bacterium]|nr:MAG: hypothetical protein DRQ09_05725 [candidate division KSB1 bacterium]
MVKRIAVLGNICVDEIHTFEGEIIKGFGGTIHNHLILSLLFGKKGIIYPVCKVGYDIYDDIIKKYIPLNNIDTSGIIKVNKKNNRVKLIYYSRSERKEYSVSNPPEIKPDEVKKNINWDLFMINFVSGIEISRKSFEQLYKMIDTTFFVDMHSLFLGFGNNGERYYREDDDWSIWHNTGDIIQMNKKEAEILSGKKLSTEKSLIDFGTHLIRIGVKIVLITLGEKGSIIFYRDGNNQVWEKIKAYNFYDNSYPTGCGDAFSSGFIYKYLQSGEPVESAIFASKIAGIKAGIKKPEDLMNNFHKYLYNFNIK